MVSPINLPGMPRSVSESVSGNQSGAGRNNTASQSVVGDQKARTAGSATIRTVEDAMNVLKARLSRRLEQQMGNGPANAQTRFSLPAFEAPSAEMVAQRVLGFVQQRLQAESRAGADTDRLAGLLSDARAGVEQGFAEAREQIKALGMMNERLGVSIDDSYSQIQKGLNDLQAQVVEGLPARTVEDSEAVAAYRVERASESLFSFEVTTEEGDRVTVQMAEQRYSGAIAGMTRSADGQSVEFSAVGGFSGRYSFSVEGDLNSQEQQALAKLFGQVEKVSDRFFDGNIQGAFRKAQDLNLSGDALASFSLSLTSTRIVSTEAYESLSPQSSASSELRPLSGLAQDLQTVARSAFDRGISGPVFEGLMNSLLQDIRQWQNDRADDDLPPASDTLMSEFLGEVTRSLNPQPSLQG